MGKSKKDLTPTAKMLQEILVTQTGNEMEEFPEKYGLDEDSLENIEVTIYVKDKNQVEHKGSRAKFMKIYEKETKMLFDNKIVDFKEFGFLTFLGTMFTSYEDNVLKNSDGAPCTQKDIIKASGMTRSTISSLLKGLIEKQLLFEEVNSEVVNGKMYYLNPMVFYKGVLISPKRKEVFRRIEDGILKQWSKKDNKKTKKQKEKINEAIHAIVEVEMAMTEDDE